MAFKTDPMLGQRLQALRKEKGETITQLAQAVNVSYPHMWEILNNKCKPSILTIRALAKHFNVSSDYLLGLTDDPDPIWVNNELERLFEATKDLSERNLQIVTRVIEALAPVI